MQKYKLLFGLDAGVILATLLLGGAPRLWAQDKAITAEQQSAQVPKQNSEAAPPTMFPHPESDRWWISGQANFISQWHPAFHSPYQGPRSLPPQAQDATSRVLTLFTGVRLTNGAELLCDVQETGGHGIGEAVGLAGVTNLDIVRNPDLSKAPYIARLMWHKSFPLATRKSTAPVRRSRFFHRFPSAGSKFALGSSAWRISSITIPTVRTPVSSS